MAIAILAGCGTVPEAGDGLQVIFARVEADGRTYHAQSLAGGQSPVALALPCLTGNLRTSGRGTRAAATVGGEPPGAAELRLLPLEADSTAERLLAREWAWDFAWQEAGDAIAWVSGRERRELFTARGPGWQPKATPVPREFTPGEPRWLDRQRLLVILRRAGESQLVVVTTDTGESRLIHRAPAGADLSDPLRIPGANEVLVVESPASAAPARLLRIGLAGGAPRELATGFFRPGTITTSPDGRLVAAVWSAELAAVQRNKAALNWIGEPWRGAPASLPGVTSLAWSPGGNHLAVARNQDGRQWIEVYSDVAGRGLPQVLGYADAECVAPQWWQSRR